jgi:SulP family sulfate permease
MPDGSSSAHLFRPKLIAIFRESYDVRDFRRDLAAALTVAIVALSMAFAIASGIAPAHGLYAAIVGGFLVSALGGSRYQIGGPAGAFIVLVSATVAAHGIGGMLLTVLLSGLLLTLLGALRMGSLIRFIPHSVTVGFTAGIAVIILASQLKDLGGLTLSGPEPGPLLPKLAALGSALPSFNPAALGVGLAVVAVILSVRRLRPGWPALLLGVVATTIGAALMQLPVETIGSRFGALPHSLPRPTLPPMSMDLFIAVLPSVLGFTLLGGVESLLSAKVADGMTGRKHRSNMELVAQGIANIGSALFGGMPVTGTIARTATNVRAGARSPPCPA